jgi:hypothetical protein
MARGSSQSEAGDRLRLKAASKSAEVDRLYAKAAEVDRLDAEKAAKAKAASETKAKADADKKMSKLIKSPQAFVDALDMKLAGRRFGYSYDNEPSVAPSLGDKDIKVDSDYQGRRSISALDFRGLYGELDKNNRRLIRQGLVKDFGMTEKVADKTAKILEAKIKATLAPNYPKASVLLGKPDYQKAIGEKLSGSALKESYEGLKRYQRYAEGRDYDGDNAMAAASQQSYLSQLASDMKSSIIPSLRAAANKRGDFADVTDETAAWAKRTLKNLPQIRKVYQEYEGKKAPF